MSVSLGKNKSQGTQSQTQQTNSASSTGVDPLTGQRMGEVWDAAKAAGEAGPSPLIGGATDYNAGLMKAGQTGVNALSGDRTALAGLMNPYQSQVIDATNANWDQNDARSRMATGSEATAAGAFGGGRHGVVEGTRLAQNDLGRSTQVAGLLSGGYQDAMQRAAQLASGGFQGAGANAGLGMQGVGNQQQWLMEMLKRGFMGPTGTSTINAGSSVGSGRTDGSGYGLSGQAQYGGGK